MARSGITHTAIDAARARSLGAEVDSIRVNSRRESSLLIPGVLLIAICLVGGPFLLTADAVPWAGKVVFALMGLLFLALGFVMTMMGVTYLRSGRWLLHEFESGFVMERTRGGLQALRYDEVTAELFEYTEPGDSTGSPIDHVVLRLVLADGTAMAMAEPRHGAADTLLRLGEQCGASAPMPLEYPAASIMLTAESWRAHRGA